METNKAFILIGVPGCGKTTAAKKLIGENPNAIYLSVDNVRKELASTDNADETTVWTTLEEQFKTAVSEGASVILDSSNYRSSSRACYIRHALLSGLRVVAIDCFSGLSVEQVVEQSGREHELVSKIAAAFEKPSFEEGFNSIITINEAA